MSEDKRSTAAEPSEDPRERLRKRMSEQEPTVVYLARENDNVLGRYQWVSDSYSTRYTRPGEKGYAAILADADLSGMFEPPEVPNDGLVAVLLLGYSVRELAKLNPQPDEWIGIRRGPKVTGGGGATYNTWDVYSAREDAGKVDLSELAKGDDWSTGAFKDEYPY